MRIIILSLIFICLISPFANADGTWEVIHQVIGSDWQDAFFLDESHGWAIGYYGDIMSTTDGGKNWDIRRHNTNKYLYYDCFFVSEKEGWITGRDGKESIFYTDDGGKTIKKNSDYGISVSLADIFFISKNDGWAVGSDVDSPFIMHTDNAGKSWETQKINDKGLLNAVFFIDNNKGFVAGQKSNVPIVYKTDNGGKTWIRQSIPIDAGSCFDIFFLNSLEGWIILDSSLIKTTDGGTTWQKIDLPQGGDYYLQHVRFNNQNDGTIIGLEFVNSMIYGLIMQTKDGGQSFDKQYNYSYINGIAGSGDKCWLVGNDNNVLYSENGKSWIPQLEKAYSLSDIEFVSKNKGFIAGLSAYHSGPDGDFVILSTDDGGDTWKEGDTHIPEDWCCFDFLDGSTAWFGGLRGIYHTNDGGKTIQKDEKLGGPIYDIAFSSNEDGWAASFEKLWRTNDGGESWQDISIGGQIYLYDIDVFGDKAIAVGYNGEIIIAENNGKNVTKVDLNANLRRICFVTDKKGWAVGSKGSIFFTDDGGKKWSMQTSGTDVSLYDVLFLSEKEGWVIGGGGIEEAVMLHTLDGGKRWTKLDYPTSEYMNKIVYSGGNHLFVIGDWGTILRYTDDSLSQYSSQFSISDTNFQPITWGKIKNQLFQNYPNPFNPETWIPYQLAEDTETTINIYNAEGKLVRTLDLGNERTGSYKALWDGKDNKGQTVASGVYFYILRSKDGFTDTKKMVLVK
jgi:photosystem II stability/assembly factor-like uncharacterized protein